MGKLWVAIVLVTRCTRGLYYAGGMSMGLARQGSTLRQCWCASTFATCTSHQLPHSNPPVKESHLAVTKPAAKGRRSVVTMVDASYPMNTQVQAPYNPTHTRASSGVTKRGSRKLLKPNPRPCSKTAKESRATMMGYVACANARWA